VRWPRRAHNEGITTLTIWARTTNGRGLIVAVRPIGPMEWQIWGVREMTSAESAEFDAWEATR
jgi:hypothetical protein